MLKQVLYTFTCLSLLAPSTTAQTPRVQVEQLPLVADVKLVAPENPTELKQPADLSDARPYGDCLAKHAEFRRTTIKLHKLCEQDRKKESSQGGLTGGEIMAVIRHNISFIRRCYEKELNVRPEAAGKITVRFTVKDYDVHDTAITKTSGSLADSMKLCIRDEINRWKFPKQRGDEPVTVTYPFTFNPA